MTTFDYVLVQMLCPLKFRSHLLRLNYCQRRNCQHPFPLKINFVSQYFEISTMDSSKKLVYPYNLNQYFKIVDPQILEALRPILVHN